MMVGERDYFMSLDLPTYLPTMGPDYLSLRLKVDHAFLDKIVLKLVFDVPDYCIYKHNGSKDGQHFHVCFPGCGRSDVNRIAKRVKDNFGVSGNGGYSLKFFDNGCSSFVFYCGHEGSLPVFANPKWQAVIDSITTYFVKSAKSSGQVMLPLEKRSKKDPDLDWQLSYAGLVPKCLNYAREHGLTCGLKETARQLFENTRWKPSYQMITKGVPLHYEEMFESRSGKRAKYSMDWWTPHF